jgi:hypothetical protein
MSTVTLPDPLVLLQQWSNGLRIAQIGHARAAAQYERLRKLLGVPVTGLSILIGTSAFSSLESSGAQWVLVAIAVLSVVTAILAGLQTFLNFAEQAARHRQAACSYGQLRRRAEQLRVLTPSKGLEDALAKLGRSWDRVEKGAPVIPQRFHDAAFSQVKSGLAPDAVR